MAIQLRTALDVGILPISALHLQATVASDEYIFGQIEGESSYTMEEQVVIDGQGCDRLLGWKVTATIYLINNSMEDLLADLKAIYDDVRTQDGKRLHYVLIELNNKIWNQHADSPWLVKFWVFSEQVSFVYGIESVEVRPRIKITLHGFVPVGQLDTTFIP
ncbi:MAG: hypothetical protein JSS89_13360 [Bacteroidetes bacterium]|nr:hypothetical protein [Bacteroidota bacterium]